MAISIVTTTIHKPTLLEDYCQNAKKFGHQNLNFIIIGDKKTPPEVTPFCKNLQKRYGYEILYYDVRSQLNFLKDFPELRDHLPFNSIQRRNIGLLKAYHLNSEVIITIDDDNLVTKDHDFIGYHSIVGREEKFISLNSFSGWFNVCQMLEEEKNLPFYPRGFPLNRRWLKTKVKKEERKGKIVVNAGLWLDDPDIDALTRMNLPIKVKRESKKYNKGICLDIGTWSPFNSQNTALYREIIPAYFLSPYIGRYDDIWASYIVKRIADHLGQYIHFGFPLVRQERNIHNLWDDFDKERFGMEMSDEFVDRLKELKLTCQSYKDCFLEIVEELEENPLSLTNETNASSMDNFIAGMKIWNNVFRTL